jgi:ATP-dependent Zn protease
VLDDALTRPGRFDKHVVVPLPDVKGRLQILELYAKKSPLAKDVNLEVLARGTPGTSA